MGLRIAQVSGLWVSIAFTLFVFVVLHKLNQSENFLPTTQDAPPRTTSRTTGQRMERAEASWQSSVSLRHQMAIAHPQHPGIPLFPAQSLAEFGKYPYTLWDFFPATYTCPHDIQRVGRLGDGGKWVCGMSLYEAIPASKAEHRHPPPSKTIIYSFGVNDESTFEAEMLARIPSAEIFAFDYSVDRLGLQISTAHSSRAFFSKVGLGAKDEPSKSPPFYTLSTLMAQNNHSYIDILKIDIEGSEYTAFDSFMDSCDASGVMPIGQVMIELHLMDDAHVNFERFTKWWERLEGFGMRPTWLEVNLMAVTLGQGKTDPRCVEYVWINAKDKRSILLQD